METTLCKRPFSIAMLIHQIPRDPISRSRVFHAIFGSGPQAKEIHQTQMANSIATFSGQMLSELLSDTFTELLRITTFDGFKF